MRKELYFWLILVLLILNIQPAFAQSSNQGLSWGLEVGDQIEYTWTITTQESPTSNIITWTENISIEITDLGPITTTHFSYLNDINHAEKYFSNSSIIPFSTDWTAVPIGNWTLMEELLTEYSQDPGLDRLDFLLAASTWRVEVDHTSETTSMVSNSTYEYSLQDGAISYLYIRIMDYPTVGYYETNELVRITPPVSTPQPYPVLDPLLLVVMAAGIGVVVIVIVIKKLYSK
ncbi:MAG: hypothetical protein E3J86_08390 [Candidatus Thorarchaeota archaeon]|nr:MAG: hypothetical protein E3J86_08390 [Candidatus Thorarchaeota archaeon]